MSSMSVERQELSAGLHEKVIHLAYAMASDSSHYVELITLVMQTLERVHRASDNQPDNPDHSATLFNRYDQWCWHMNNALNLLEQNARFAAPSSSLMKSIDEDVRPAFLVNGHCVVVHGNEIAQKQLQITAAQTLTKNDFEEDGIDVLRTALRGITLGSNANLPMLVHVPLSKQWSPEGGSELMVITSATLSSGESVARLTAVTACWDDTVGRSFQSAFQLTNVDFEIVRALALGKTMNELADQRRRARTTMRQQLKNLLKKLGLHTQKDLIRLYGGYLQLRSDNAIDRPHQRSGGKPTETEIAPEIASLSRPSGRQVEYYSFGPANGRPVINVHTITVGASFTPTVVEELYKHSIRLICPWRPGFAGTSPSESQTDTDSQIDIETDLGDILAVMDALSIESAPLLAHSAGVIVANALAKKSPDRVRAVVAAAGNVPVVEDAHLEEMPLQFRSIFLVARYTPELLPFLTRARIAFDDNKPARETMGDQLSPSPADESLLRDPETSRLLEQSRRDITRQGASAYAREVQLAAKDWTHLLPDPSIPIVYLQGIEDNLHSADRARAFLAIHGNAKLNELAETGRLVFLKRPGAVLESIEGFF